MGGERSGEVGGGGGGGGGGVDRCGTQIKSSNKSACSPGTHTFRQGGTACCQCVLFACSWYRVVIGTRCVSFCLVSVCRGIAQ